MKTEDTNYQSIDCGLHSQYELAIMHRQLCRFEVSTTAGINDIIATPIDIYCRDQEEFLLLDTIDNTKIEVRLNKILSHQTNQ